jgi:hypothetical protein
MSIPPTPTRREEIDTSAARILLEIFPALARVLVELPREDQRAFSFQPFHCPVRRTLEQVVGQQIAHVEKSKPDLDQFFWLSRLATYALELADEIHQLDGKAALDFATGYVAGETSTHDLFGGPETEEQALADAIEQSPLRASQASPFASGFQARRDQRRADAADGKESS